MFDSPKTILSELQQCAILHKLFHQSLNGVWFLHKPLYLTLEIRVWSHDDSITHELNTDFQDCHLGSRLNIKMPSDQNGKSHCGDKEVSLLSYLYKGISYTGKTTSLYWVRASVPDRSLPHRIFWWSFHPQPGDWFLANGTPRNLNDEMETCHWNGTRNSYLSRLR